MKRRDFVKLGAIATLVPLSLLAKAKAKTLNMPNIVALKVVMERNGKFYSVETGEQYIEGKDYPCGISAHLDREEAFEEYLDAWKKNFEEFRKNNYKEKKGTRITFYQVRLEKELKVYKKDIIQGRRITFLEDMAPIQFWSPAHTTNWRIPQKG